jgi:hypothetical protein
VFEYDQGEFFNTSLAWWDAGETFGSVAIRRNQGRPSHRFGLVLTDALRRWDVRRSWEG